MSPAPDDTVAVTMPQLGETVAEGTVLRWLKQVGDTVDDQEPLLEIATDKVDTEVPSPGAGVLVEIVVGEDTTVAVGTVLAHLGRDRGAAEQPAPASEPVTGVGAAAAPAPPAQASAPEAGSGPRHRHSPRVRRLAREAGLDPDTLDGTGPRGRVTPEDVARAAEGGEAAQPAIQAAQPSTSSPRPAPPAAATGPAGGAPQPAAAGVGQGDAAVAGAVRSVRTVTATVDLTSLLRTAAGVGSGATADDRFVAVATTQAVAALRACPALLGSGAGSDHVAVTVRRTAADGARVALVDHAEELNADGILRRLREAPTASSPSAGTSGTAHATLEFAGEDHVVVDVEDPWPGQVVSIGFSRPSPHVVVVDQDGAAGIGIRHTAYVSVCFDQAQADAPLVRTFLRDLVARLACA
ncbi:biotin/lipoyl-containing protein [Phycicoccus sp. 3266]|uniref:biotin/lipoyl-containing protein n=1 Tax=Phycicoccus sp. 3266 TaxID=2817751 RepID=UPI00285B5B6C|nr:biotin/lipoyl-containing protein [Phycicoccus sp. 3266]MDR6862660.1 2-oxoglutarate dehydrogenase E2 component (dihydrolipoamide succinyltransferase) [Phycicoccus sp. 3266]